MTITLNDAEIKLATYVGKKRNQASRAQGVEDKRKSEGMTSVELDIDGMGAEIALAKILNVYPDLHVQPRRGGWDVIVAGVAIDVKQSRYDNAHLIATPFRNQGEADVYALMVGTLPTYELRGFCTAEQMYVMHNIRNFGRGPCHAVKQDELMTLEEARAF